jgi:hypothetical protein
MSNTPDRSQIGQGVFAPDPTAAVGRVLSPVTRPLLGSVEVGDGIVLAVRVVVAAGVAGAGAAGVGAALPVAGGPLRTILFSTITLPGEHRDREQEAGDDRSAPSAAGPWG